MPKWTLLNQIKPNVLALPRVPLEQHSLAGTSLGHILRAQVHYRVSESDRIPNSSETVTVLLNTN